MSNFVQIQSGNFRALVRPENLAKAEEKLAKVKPPVNTFPKPSARDRARVFPVYKPGMSTAQYVRRYEIENAHISKASAMPEIWQGLNENPAAQYDSSVPLCVEDANPDYIPGVDDAPVKVKRTRKTAKVMPEKSAVMWLLMDHGLTMYQANPLADKLIALFGGEE